MNDGKTVLTDANAIIARYFANDPANAVRAHQCVTEVIAKLGQPAAREADPAIRNSLITGSDTAMASAPVAAPSDETLRLAGVIADKIEDGTLFQAGIFSRRELADKVRTVARLARQSAPVAGVVSVVPDDDAIAEAWMTLSEVDGIEYHGPSFGRGYRAALLAAHPPAPAAEPVQKCKVRDRGFVVVNGKHVPTVLVEFDIDDWNSRDRFAASVAAPAAESAEPSAAAKDAA